MDDFGSFIARHEGDDVPRLLLSCREWPDSGLSLNSDLDRKSLAASTLAVRRRLKTKVPEWYSIPSLVYTNSLSGEQCSSSEAAFYKASLVGRILGGIPGRVADLTGGLGVDSWAFSKVASRVLYNERDSLLAEAARHNFGLLGADNIEVRSVEVTGETLESVAGGGGADLIFLDPARRSSEGKKVFLLEDCSPDVLELLPGLFSLCRHILLKLSPMADISLVARRLNRSYEAFLESSDGTGWNGRWVREVHVVAVGGECKELLVWLDRDWDGEYSLICREDGGTLRFEPGEISGAKVSLPSSVYADILFEPGKSLLKAGVSNALCGRFGLVKLARFTHLFTFGDSLTSEERSSVVSSLKGFGKFFRVNEILPFDKRSMRNLAERFPSSEVTAMNIPLTSEELRSRLGVRSGDDAHIFGVRIETPFQSGNFLLVCHKVNTFR